MSPLLSVLFACADVNDTSAPYDFAANYAEAVCARLQPCEEETGSDYWDFDPAAQAIGPALAECEADLWSEMDCEPAQEDGAACVVAVETADCETIATGIWGLPQCAKVRESCLR